MGAERYTGYPIVVESTTYQHTRQVTASAEIEEALVNASGNLLPLDHFVAFEEPKFDIVSFDLATFLTNVGLAAGLNCPNGAVLQLQKRAAGGDFASGIGANHVTATSTRGFCMIDEISAEQDETDPARITASYMVLSDGVNAPLVWANTDSLTGVVAVPTLYTLGPLYVNGSLVTGLQRTRVTAQNEFEHSRGDGDTIGQSGSNVRREPLVEAELKNTSFLVSHGLGMSAAPGSITQYFRKAVSGGKRVADATAEHIAVTVATSTMLLEQIDAQDQTDASLRLQVKGTGDFSINTASAIPSA